jgi:hypothetical protein
MLPDTSNSSAALLRMSQGRLSYLRRILPALTNQSEDCLYLNVYLPIQGTEYLPVPQCLPPYTRYRILASTSMSTCLYKVQNTYLYLNVYLPIQGTEYLPLPQCLPAYTMYRILASQLNVYLAV